MTKQYASLSIALAQISTLCIAGSSENSIRNIAFLTVWKVRHVQDWQALFSIKIRSTVLSVQLYSTASFSPQEGYTLYRIHHHCNQHSLYGLLLSRKVWCVPVQHFSQREGYVICYVSSFCWEQSVPNLCHHRHLVPLQTALPTV